LERGAASNKKDPDFETIGGSPENRARFIVEVLNAMIDEAAATASASRSRRRWASTAWPTRRRGELADDRTSSDMAAASAECLHKMQPRPNLSIN